MKEASVQIDLPAIPASYHIRIGNGLLDDAGPWARGSLDVDTKRVAVISNPTVYGLYGDRTISSLQNAGFETVRCLVGDGETYKNLETVESVLTSLAADEITRSDAVVALGGGVVGDIAGFASAIHLRGVSLLQIPTTLLAMIDSSVGGKTGVNSPAGKNLIGAFHQPKGVLIDIAVLATLDGREVTAGLCEAVKHGAIGGTELLGGLTDLLSARKGRDFAELSEDDRFQELLIEVIARQVEFKANIVTDDEKESSARNDARSRKILNFGHTLAHALESVTGYEYFRHGEAVGYGILFAAELSKNLALCDKIDVQLLNDVVQSVGPLPALTGIDLKEVRKAFTLDKKNLAGSLQMVLLKGIGKPVIVSEQDIPPNVMTRVLEEFLAKWA
jgi:3-dehydroquinate synthase